MRSCGRFWRVSAIATGHFAAWFLLLFVPTRVAALFLQIFFSWLPHYPFDRTERYLNTRISLWPGGTVILLQPNAHPVRPPLPLGAPLD